MNDSEKMYAVELDSGDIELGFGDGSNVRSVLPSEIEEMDRIARDPFLICQVTKQQAAELFLSLRELLVETGYFYSVTIKDVHSKLTDIRERRSRE